MDDSMEGKNYSQTDYLAEIGFQAQPGDIYYMNPPKELSSYPMYISINSKYYINVSPRTERLGKCIALQSGCLFSSG